MWTKMDLKLPIGVTNPFFIPISTGFNFLLFGGSKSDGMANKSIYLFDESEFIL